MTASQGNFTRGKGAHRGRMSELIGLEAMSVVCRGIGVFNPNELLEQTLVFILGTSESMQS